MTASSLQESTRKPAPLANTLTITPVSWACCQPAWPQELRRGRVTGTSAGHSCSWKGFREARFRSHSTVWVISSQSLELSWGKGAVSALSLHRRRTMSWSSRSLLSSKSQAGAGTHQPCFQSVDGIAVVHYPWFPIPLTKKKLVSLKVVGIVSESPSRKSAVFLN